jgi:hypothetical protein
VSPPSPTLRFGLSNNVSTEAPQDQTEAPEIVWRLVSHREEIYTKADRRQVLFQDAAQFTGARLKLG